MTKNTKKALIMALLLFTFIGVVGYGVYSYYYTEGSVATPSASGDENADNVIRITGSFNPTFTTGGSSGSSGSGGSFLAQGGTVTLDCPSITGGYETITCTASVTVHNEGSTEISVYYDDEYASASSEDVTVSAGSPSLSWGSSSSEYSSTIISAGSNETLHISVDVNVGSYNYISDNTAHLVTEPVESGTLNAYVSFRIGASQRTDY